MSRSSFLSLLLLLGCGADGGEVTFELDPRTDAYRRCEAGDGQGCFELGEMARTGKHGEQDFAAALRAHEQGCTLRHAPACTQAGYVLQVEDSALRSPAKAVPKYEKGCALGDGVACMNLASIYTAGQGGVPQDFVRGARYNEKACESDLPDACSDLSSAYLQGLGVSVDLGKAEALAEKACELEDRLCFNLGVMHAQGVDGGSMEQAIALFRKACDAENGDACFNLAALASQGIDLGPDAGSVNDLFATACERGSANGCHQQALRLSTGEGVPKDEGKAKEIGLRACEMGHAEACTTWQP